MAIIIFGAQNLMIKKQIRKYINETFSKPSDVTVNYMDSHIVTEGNIIDECQQLSLTCNDKVVVVENSNFLTAERSKDKLEYSNELLDYLKNENPITHLIFTVVYDKKLDSRNKIVKYITEKGRIIECKDLKVDDWLLYATKYFEKRSVRIEKSAIKELCNRCNGDLNVFINETDKLLLYKMNNITLDDVKKIVTKPLEDNVFDILQDLLKGNKAKAIGTYRDLTLQKVEPVVLISIISSSLMFLDRCLFLSREGFSNSIIATRLNSNPYRVMITLQDFKNVDSEKIKKALDDLYFLDKTIKHNEIDRFYGFEMFLLNF